MTCSDSSLLLEDGERSGTKKYQTLMCSRCRSDKQKCHPVDRDWETKQQKCERCNKFGYDCGPSERAPRKVKRMRSTTLTTTAHYERDMSCKADETPQSTRCSLLHEETIPSAPRYHQLGITSRSHDSQTSTYFTPHLNIPRFIDVSDDYHGLSRFKRGLIHLGDLYATRELLRRDSSVCVQVETWLGPSYSIIAMVKDALQDFICAIQEDFERCVKDTRCLVPPEPPHLMQKTLLELYFIAYKFANPPPSTIAVQNSREHDADTSGRLSMETMLHTLHQRTFTYSDADFVWGNIWNPPLMDFQQDYQQDYPATYRKASMAIDRILFKTVLRNSEHKKLLLGPSIAASFSADSSSAYSPCHLAAMNGHSLLASDLRKPSTVRTWETDLLRRTSVHAATYMSKTCDLRSYLDQVSTSIVNIPRDIFGLTPLTIAACRDDIKTVNLLVQYGADLTVRDWQGRTILALAARNGSQNTIEQLLCHSDICDTLCLVSDELGEAITHDHRAVAKLLMEHYSVCKAIDNSSIYRMESAIGTAKQKGFIDIADGLESLRSTLEFDPFDQFDSESMLVCVDGDEQDVSNPIANETVCGDIFADDTGSLDMEFMMAQCLDQDFNYLEPSDTTTMAVSWE